MPNQFQQWLRQIGHRVLLPSVAMQYARLVGTMLWNAFSLLSVSDFSDSADFASSNKSSANLSHYLKVSNSLTAFVQHSIGDRHDDQSAARAFSKWLDAVTILHDNACYEGFWLIMTSLFSRHTAELEEHLSPYHQQKWREYANLISITNNFANLRQLINHNVGCFKPTALWFRDLTGVEFQPESEVYGSQTEQIRLDLQDKKQQLLAEIAQLLNDNQRKTTTPLDLNQFHSLMVGYDSAAATVALDHLELIRLELLTGFMHHQFRTTGLFGGETRIVAGNSYKVPAGIALIYDKLADLRRCIANPLEVLNEVYEIAQARQQISHGFFNSRQSITSKFYQQCSASIEHLIMPANP